MSFWSGFVEQWNYEDAKSAKEAEREEDMAFAREQLHTNRTVELMKMGVTRGAKSDAKVQEMSEASLWLANKLPKDHPQYEEYMAAVKRDPSVAIKIQSLFDDRREKTDDKGLRAMTGEEMMNIYQIVQSDPKILEDNETMSELMSRDLSISDNYEAVWEAKMNQGSDAITSSVVVDGDTSILDSAAESKQNEVFQAALVKESQAYTRFLASDENTLAFLKRNNISKESANAAWESLFQQYNKGNDVQAGIIVTNTMKMWDKFGAQAIESPTLHNWQKNAYFSNVYRGTLEDDTNFTKHLLSLEEVRKDASRNKSEE
jgi:hypothetical protein